MAANFWTSQHHRTLLQEVSQEHHQPDIERGLTTDDVQAVKAFFVGYLFQLVAAMSEKQKMRQQVACSAATFFHRFYSKNSFSEHDPRLIAPCCLYLAGKVEENLVNAAVLEHQLRARQFSLGVKVEATTLVDLELLLLDALDYNLVVFSPRQALHAYLRDLGAVLDQGKLAKCALAVLNDSFWSDASLVYNPPTLALASLIVAGMFTGAEEKLPGWLAKLQQVDLEQTHSAVQKLLYLYQHDKFRMQQSRVLHLLSCTAQS